jgi:hypothetical protein
VTARLLPCLVAAAALAACARAPAQTPPASASAPPVAGPCGAAYPDGVSLVAGPTNDPVPAVARPARGVPFADPTYHTCIVRSTDHARDGLAGFARHDYSRRQAFSADGSRFLVVAEDGSWHLYDARTQARLGALPGVGGDAEPQWHPADPDILYYLPGNGGLTVHELAVSNGRARVVGDFRGRLPWPAAAHVWTRSEGSPSADGRFWAFMVEDSAFKELGFFVWDRERDAIGATYATSKRPDHLSMSPTGNHVVVSWDDGVVAFDRDFKNPRTIHSRGEHSDIALDAGGDDVFVSVDYDSNDGAVFMHNLRTGTRTSLFPTYLGGTATALHFSGKAFARPGWVLVSAYADYGGRQQWLHRKVFAVSLTSSPRIYALAHHHSVHNGYWTEPQATVSRDFTKVLFNSNWDVNSATDVDAYMVQVPAGALR